MNKLWALLLMLALTTAISEESPGNTPTAEYGVSGCTAPVGGFTPTGIPTMRVRSLGVLGG
jgi:hypothetical protein